jgi:predicted CXXCH cytochrome family protein
MRPLLAALLALTLVAVVRGSARGDSCVDCHAGMDDSPGSPVHGMKEDVHAKEGLSCADCHGGDPTDDDVSAMDEAKGYRGAPKAAEIPAFCGRCHADGEYMRRYRPELSTDQVAQYQTSVHGKRLAAGDTKVATCVSCHGVHGILPGSDTRSPVHKTRVATTCAHCHADAAYMREYDIPTNQFAAYQRSVHAEHLLVQRDLAAPSCNSCHGNHGAFPPGAASVAEVCGQCHVSNKELFMTSPHNAAFAARGLAQCVACHGNHDIAAASDDMLGTGDRAVCISCHTPDSPGFAAARHMREAIDDLRNGVDAAKDVLAKAAAAGMEVSEADFDLQGAHQALVAARTQVHAADPVALDETIGGGLKIAQSAEQTGRMALVELADRRWMALLPLGMIALVGLLITRKIRELDRD